MGVRKYPPIQPGARYGRWTIQSGPRRDANRYYWTCRCECGSTREVLSHHLANGASTNCGCSIQSISAKHRRPGEITPSELMSLYGLAYKEWKRFRMSETFPTPRRYGTAVFYKESETVDWFSRNFSRVVESLPGEEWRPVVGLETYFKVSNLGRVVRLSDASRGMRGERLMTPFRRSRKPYLSLNLLVNKQLHPAQLHRIVAYAFLQRDGSRDQINHIDGNPQNNRVANLEWVTASENMRHAFDHLDAQARRMRTAAERGA